MAANWFEADFLKASFKGDVAMLTSLANMASTVYGEELERIVDREERNAVHLAAVNGKTTMCQFLLEALDFNINCRDRKGNTPLIVAIQTQQDSTAVYLIDKGADIGLSNHGGFSALHYAARTGQIKIMRMLLSRGVPDLNTAKICTPLQCACLSRDMEALKLLLDHDADPNATVERYESPLMISIGVESLECMEVLLEAGADPNLSSSGRTPLIFAACKGDTKIINCLLKARANPDVVESSKMMTPLELAAFYKHVDAVRTLFPVTSRIPSLSDWSVDGLLKIERAYTGERSQQLLQCHEMMQNHLRRFETVSHTALIAIKHNGLLLLGCDSMATAADDSFWIESKKFVRIYDTTFIAFSGDAGTSDEIMEGLVECFTDCAKEAREIVKVEGVAQAVILYINLSYKWEDLEYSEKEVPLHALLVGQIGQDSDIFEIIRNGNKFGYRKGDSVLTAGIGAEAMDRFTARHSLESYVHFDSAKENEEGLVKYAAEALEEATKGGGCGGPLTIILISGDVYTKYIYELDPVLNIYKQKHKIVTLCL